MRDFQRSVTEVLEGDTRSLDYSSHGEFLDNVRLERSRWQAISNLNEPRGLFLTLRRENIRATMKGSFLKSHIYFGHNPTSASIRPLPALDLKLLQTLILRSCLISRVP